MIDCGPSKSIGSIAKDIIVLEFLISQVMPGNSRCSSYKRRNGKLLPRFSWDNGEVRATKHLNKLNHPSYQTWFSFYQTKISCWTHRTAVCLPYHPNMYREWGKWIFQLISGVLGEVTSDGNVTLTFIFANGFWLIREAYIKYLEVVVVLWVMKVAARIDDTWQQDSAPFHTAQMTQSYLSDNFCNLITPNIWSPETYYLFADYFWGVVERESNTIHCSTKYKLTVVTNLNKVTPKSCRRFRSRLRVMVGANGDFID